VAEWQGSYSLGIWAEVTKAGFDRIHELWDEPDQSQEPAFDATLANSVPFHAPTNGMPGLLWLTGPTTRPEFRVLAAENTLFAEQRDGISAHRANEYTRLTAKQSHRQTPAHI
jgi:hypothetical protein